MSESNDSSSAHHEFFASWPCAAWLLGRGGAHPVYGNQLAAALNSSGGMTAVDALGSLFRLDAQCSQTFEQMLAAAFDSGTASRAEARLQQPHRDLACVLCVWPFGTPTPVEHVGVMVWHDQPPVSHTLPRHWPLRVSHDLRGPITPIRMAVQILRSGRISAEEQDQSLRLIDRQVDRLLAEIECTSDLLRLQAGVLQLNEEYADLNLVLDAICGKRQLMRTLEERGQQLETSPSEHAVLVQHDPRRLLQLLEFVLQAASRQAPIGQVLRLGLDVTDSVPLIVIDGISAASDLGEVIAVLIASNADTSVSADSQTLLVRELIRLGQLALKWDDGKRRLCLGFRSPAG